MNANEYKQRETTNHLLLLIACVLAAIAGVLIGK